jgi:DDE superfamily endonuclease
VDETVALLAARAPKLRPVVRAAGKASPYAVPDGTLILTDRVAADRPFLSGKHRRHGMNLQVMASPRGELIWVSGVLPGAVHDSKAAWIWGIERELAAGRLPWPTRATRAPRMRSPRRRGKQTRIPETGQQGARKTPRTRRVRKRAAQGLGILRKLHCGPWRAGQIAKAILVLQTRETTTG